jgi:hypothetical protein
MTLNRKERARLVEWGEIVFRNSTLDWSIKDEELSDKLRKSLVR